MTKDYLNFNNLTYLIMPIIKCNYCNVKTLCTEYLRGAACHHEVTDEEILQATLRQTPHRSKSHTKSHNNDISISEVLSNEFMTGRQNT